MAIGTRDLPELINGTQSRAKSGTRHDDLIAQGVESMMPSCQLTLCEDDLPEWIIAGTTRHFL